MQELAAELYRQSRVPLPRCRQPVTDLGAPIEAHARERIDQSCRHPRGRTAVAVVDDANAFTGLDQVPGQCAAGQTLAEDQGIERGG